MRDDEITGLYYDLKAPYEVLVQLDEGDTNAIGIGRYLEKRWICSTCATRTAPHSTPASPPPAAI